MRQNQQSEPLHLYTYGPHFQEPLICPCIWRYTWKIHSFEWFEHLLFCLMVLCSFVKITLLFHSMDRSNVNLPHHHSMLKTSTFKYISDGELNYNMHHHSKDPWWRHKQSKWYHRQGHTVKLILSGHSKIDKIKVLKTNGSLMKVESIAECSLGTFCNTFDLH